MPETKRRSSIPLVAFAAILWGTTGLAGRLLTEHYLVSPLCVAGWRLAVAAPALLLWERLRRGGSVPVPRLGAAWKWFAVYGVAVALYQVSFFSAIDLAPVSGATIVTLCLAPVVVLLLAPVLLSERLNSKTLGVVALAIVGTMLVVGLDGLTIEGPERTGYALALVAAVCYALYNICGKKLVVGFSPEFVISRVFTLGALLLSPTLFRTPALPLEGWACIAYLGLVPSALAYGLFQTGLSSCKATSSSVASLLEPLTSATLAVLFLGETLSPTQLVGGGLLVGSIFLLIRVEAAA